MWSVRGASFWMWSSPQNSVLVWTGCRRNLSWRRSLAGSTCESLWSTSGCKNSNRVGITIHGIIHLTFKEVGIRQLPLLMTQSNLLHPLQLGRNISTHFGDSPGEHVTGFFHLVTWNVMFYIWFVDPGLNVDDLLPVVVWHGRAVDLIWGGNIRCIMWCFSK